MSKETELSRKPINYKRYKHIPFTMRAMLDEWVIIVNDPRERMHLRVYFDHAIEAILAGASDYEMQITAAQIEAYRRGYSDSQMGVDHDE